MSKVLVTGGSGFVGGHVIDVLLKRGHSVVTAVRSQAKGDMIRNVHKDASRDKLDYVLIPDIAAPGAFEALPSYRLDAAIHVASPFHYNVTDPKKDLIDPAVLGTTGVLQAIADSCPTVRRVVLTSSFAAILNPRIAAAGAQKVYTEVDWSPLTMNDINDSPAFAYVVSKVAAEQAAWDFVKEHKPRFTLSVINPTMVYGPVPYKVESLESVNTSNQTLAEVLLAKYKAGLPPTALPLWVDVRDVALAHVKAMETEEAANQRFLVTAGHCSNAEMGAIIYDSFPELREKLPEKENMGGAPNPNPQSFGYDTTVATTTLGLEWTPYKDTIIDSVKSLLYYQ